MLHPLATACLPILLLASASTALAAPPVAPRILSQTAPIYPQDALAAGQEGVVLLRVDLDTRGRIVAVAVETGVAPTLDDAAIRAVWTWTFAPATRDGRSIAGRVRVPVRFQLPVAVLVDLPPLDYRPAEPSLRASRHAPATAATELDEGVVEVTARGQRRPPPRAVSDYTFDAEAITIMPKASAAEMLAAAPGITVNRTEGEAVAHEIVLRGFDAEHGQDIALSLDGVPLNEVSHIHGQGYADLGVIIPETVRALRVIEGVWDPRQGDFAVAGSIDFELGVAQRRLEAKTEIGSFGTVRQLLLWAPEDEPEKTFGAAVIRSTDGFGQNRGALSGSAVGQWAFETDRGTQGVVHLSGYGARAGLAGVLRLDDVEAGVVDLLGSYDNPTATSQSALASRFLLSARLETPHDDGARTGGLVWLQRSAFRIRSNFTGFVERSVTRPEWVGRGDLIEQENQNLAFGGTAFHRTRRYRPHRLFHGNLEAGLSLRSDFIEQGQTLLQAPQNETWDERVDASLRTLNVGLYLDTDWKLGSMVTLRGGVRADVLLFDVDDRLGHYLPSFSVQSHIVGFRRTATGVAWGPRASLQVTPLRSLDLMLAYGEGYRSPQARQLAEGESAPFAKVRSIDGGLRWAALPGQGLTVSLAGFATFLSADLAFDPGSGSLEHIGPTTRAGVTAYASWRVAPWSIGSLSVTWVYATLDAPPPATADNPTPPYEDGQRLPYVPPLVVRLDTATEGALASFGGGDLIGRLGVGLGVMSARPLPFGEEGETVVNLDLSGSLRWRWVEVGLDVRNVTGRDNPAAEYSYVSDWGSAEVPSLLPARHLSAGPPRSFTGVLRLSL